MKVSHEKKINDKSQIKFKNITVEWADAHKFSPAPRHRRRIILNILKRIEFGSCLDVGCAQPYLLEILSTKCKRVFGCDISDKVIWTNRKNFPEVQFEEVNISKEIYPFGKEFDLVISSEVLEHIEDWRSAIKNLTKMSNRYILITVPSGKVHNIDKIVGHLRHYSYTDLKDEIVKNGFTVVLYRYWGIPFHTLYKYAINLFDYKETYENFALERYGLMKKIISHFLYVLFYFNDIFRAGSQLFILAERKNR